MRPQGFTSQVFTAVGYGAVRETRRKAFQSILPNVDRRYGLQSFLSRSGRPG